MEEAEWTWPREWTGQRVFDLHGVPMGRVAGWDRAHLVVELSLRQMAQQDAPARFVRVPASDIVDVDDHDVTLRERAGFVLHPERAPDPGITGRV